MDSLTKLLIKDLLPESIDGKEVTAVFGGGFKPPTAGHLAVIQNALKNNPEIDNIIIYVGSKVRDGITQDQSFKIWDEHYKSLIDKPVRVEKSVSPIGDIYRYAKDNPEDSIYWIIGARKGREDDLQDISSRSVSIDKYPNLNLKVTSTPDGGMSGTNARQALINNDKENFNFFIPSNTNQDEIWNILTSQPLNESVKIDMSKVNKALLKGIGKEDETDENILALIDSHPPGKVSHKVFLNFYAKFDKYFGEKDDDRILDEIGLEYLLTRVLNLSPKEIRTVMNDYQKGNRDLEDINWFEKYDTVHQKDEEWNPVKGEKFDDTQDNEATVNQYLSKNKRLHEADPKKGTGKKPKGSKRRLYTDENPKDTVKVKFSTRQDIIDTLNKTSFKSKSHARQSQVINLIHQRVRAALSRTKDPQKKAKLRSAFEYIKKRKEASKKKTQRLKKQKTNEAIDTNFDKVKFYYDYYTNVSPSTFGVTMEENNIKISNITEPYPPNFGPKNVRQIPVNQNLEESLNEDILEKTSLVLPRGKKIYLQAESEDYDRGLIVELTKEGGYKMNYWYGDDAKVYPVEVLVDSESIKPDAIEVYMKFHPELKKENIAPKAQAKHKGKAAPFGSAYKKVNETGLEIAKKNMDDYKKSNTLNENATYSNHIDYKQEIVDLTKHMLKKGMNIKPLPKVVFKHNDKENAQEFLGKTAYYNPNNMTIVLYTEGRHPKDIARSYAHEMIHHIQKLEDRLENIVTTNTLEDDHLNNIEREAYTRGNMVFRNYTDGKDGEEVTSLNEKEKPYKHKYGFDKNLGKDPFGLNQFARELATLEEGRYDTLSNQISRDIFNFWKEDFDEGEKDSTYEDNYDFPPRGIQVYAQIIYKPKFGKLKVDGGSDYAYINKKTGKKYPGFIKVTFIVDPKMLPEFWEEISMNLKDVVRHEIEHITQSGDSKTKREDFDEEFDIAIRALVKADIIPQAEYFKLPKEVDANLQGMYFRAKKERRPLIDVINTYLDAQDITPKDKQVILNLWRSRRKALSLPKF